MRLRCAVRRSARRVGASSSAWNFGPGVSWSVFSAGRNRAQLQAANALHQQALIGYEATVHRVLEEVESSLTRYGKGLETLALLAEAADLRHRHTEIESLRFGNGIVSRLDVLDANAQALAADMQRLDQQVRALTQLVGLYKALGGGWATAEQLARAGSEQPQTELEEKEDHQ